MMQPRERQCEIRATNLEEVLAACNRHVHNITLTQLDLIDNCDGTATDAFYINMFREAWLDMRDDIQAMIDKENK